MQHCYASKQFLTSVEVACLNAEGITLILVAAHCLNSILMAHCTFLEVGSVWALTVTSLLQLRLPPSSSATFIALTL